MSAASSTRYEESLGAFQAGLGADWSVERRRDGPLLWALFSAEESDPPTQGWKIHISAAASDAAALCERVLPLLVESRTSFKVPATLEGFIHINSGIAGETQIGKIVTLYPSSNVAAADLARRIDVVWPQSNGPLVAAELAVRRKGAVTLRYGAFGGGPQLVTHAGTNLALVNPDGSLEPDDRSRPFPPWAPPLRLAYVLPESPDLMREIRCGPHEFLPITLLHSSPKGKVFYGIATHDAAEVAIKVVGLRTSEDLNGFNAGRKLEREFEMLAELETRAPGLAPSPVGVVAGDPAVLITRVMEGSVVEELSPRDRVSALPLLAASVGELHDAGFVHRDLKPCHAVQGADRVRLIDFELAARIGETDAPLGGTHGYLPPEGDEGPAAPAADVYALGVCIAHAMLDYEPGLLPRGSGRLVGLLHVVGARHAGRLVAALTHIDRDRRPDARKAAELIAESQGTLNDELAGTSRARRVPRRRREAWRAAIEAAEASRGFSRVRSQGRAWRNTHLESDFEAEGINLGSAGIVLGLMSVGEALGVQRFDGDACEGATALASDVAPAGSCGLYTGSAGVALALTVCGLRARRVGLLDAARERLRTAVANCRDLDLFSGAAGIVWAGCLMADVVGDDWPINTVKPLVDRLVETVSSNNGCPLWPGTASAWGEDETLTGAAHGGAGIAMALGIWGAQCGDKRATGVALKAFHELYRVGRTRDGASLAMTVGGQPTASNTWCHGAAGYLWCLLQSFGDRAELGEPIEWAVQCLAGASLVGDVTYCHGVSGQLEVWRMLRRVERYRVQARTRVELLTDVLLTLRQRKNGLSVWCSEDPSVVTPDLWLGFLAPATALALDLADCNHSLLSSSWLRAVAGCDPAVPA